MTTEITTTSKISVPAYVGGMATCERFRHSLFPMFWRPIERGDVLIPEGAARAAIDELDAAMRPMDLEGALVLAHRLIGYFPWTASKAGQDAQDIFIQGLCETMMVFPRQIGERAVHWLKLNSKHLAQADLHEACESQMKELRSAKGIAEAHIREHAKRALETKDEFDLSSRYTPEELEAQRADVQAGLADLAGRLKMKAGLSYEAQAEARKATLRAMTPEEFEADTDAMLAKMRAEEPAYLARLEKANRYVMDLKAKRAAGRQA